MNKRLALLTIGGALLLTGCNKSPNVTLVSEIRDSGKLVLAEMSVRKVGKIKDKPISQSTGLKSLILSTVDAMKIGDRIAVYSFDSYIRAYVDLSQVTEKDIDVNRLTNTVTITLPKITTEFSGRDFEMKEEHYRVSGMRSDVSTEERAQLKEKMNQSLREEVEKDPTFKATVTKAAEQRADSYFKALLGRYGYDVVVKFS